MRSKRPNHFVRLQEQHAVRPPALTSVRYCPVCGATHSGHCDLVSIPARTRQGRPVNVPHFHRASWPARRRTRVVKHYGE